MKVRLAPAELKFIVRNQKSFYIIIFFYIFLIITNKSISPDLRVFIEQSRRMFLGEDVYFPGNDYVAYNSSFLYLLIYPLTFFTFEISTKIFMFINLFIIIKIFRILLSNSQFILEHWMQKILFLVVSFHFSTRSILNNGQVGLIVLLSLFYIWYYLKNMTIKTQWIVAINLFVAFELKPYLITLGLLYFFIEKKYIYLFKFILIEIIYQFTIFLFFPSASFFYYIKRIIYRSGVIGEELDQSSFYVISKRFFPAHEFASVLLYISLIALVIVIVIRFKTIDISNRFLLICSASVLVSPYFHRQDALFLSIIYIYFYLHYNSLKESMTKLQSYLTFFLIATMFQYGGSNIKGVFFVSSVWLLLLLNVNLGIAIRTILFSSNLILNLSLFILYNKYSYLAAYKMWTVLILIASFFQFIHSRYLLRECDQVLGR